MLEISLFGGGATTTGNAVAVAGNVGITGNLSVGGNLSIFQFTANKTITTTNYQLVVAEDISLNGRVIGSSDASFGGNLWVGGTTGITVTGGMSLSGTAATNIASAINLSNYAPKASPTFTGTTTTAAVTSSGLITANGGLTVTAPLNLPNGSVTNAMLATSYATTAGPTFTGTTNTADVTSSGTITGQTVNVAGGSSPGNALAVGGNVVITGNAVINKLLTTNGGLTVTAGTITLPASSVATAALTGTLATIGSTAITAGGIIGTLTGVTLSNPTFSGTLSSMTLANPTFTGTLNFPATSVPNSALVNSAISIAGTSVPLGSSISQGTICSGYATTSSLASYAPLASPTFSGTVTLPQISYNYSSVPTLSTTSIGYNVTYGNTTTITAPTDLYKVTPVAGVYIFNIDATFAGPSPAGNYATNLYLQKAGVTQVYAVKGWAGTAYNYGDAPVSLTAFLSVDGTQEVKFYITTSNTSVIVTYYAKHMRIA